MKPELNSFSKSIAALLLLCSLVSFSGFAAHLPAERTQTEWVWETSSLEKTKPAAFFGSPLRTDLQKCHFSALSFQVMKVITSENTHIKLALINSVFANFKSTFQNVFKSSLKNNSEVPPFSEPV